eukprot:gene7441-6935_t
MCGASPGCAAAVFTGEDCPHTAHLCRGHCTLRTEADLKQRVTGTNTVACVPKGVGDSAPFTIPATVPGDLVTDLENEGLIPDPLTDSNFRNASMWNGPLWKYKKGFARPAAAGEVLLVFEGIKMGAQISLNGVALGNATDQFVRWIFPVGQMLKASNEIEVAFDRRISAGGRFMAASGGWDWAPYSHLRDVDGNQMFTRGVWKSVYLVGVPAGGAAITYVLAELSVSAAHGARRRT